MDRETRRRIDKRQQSDDPSCNHIDEKKDQLALVLQHFCGISDGIEYFSGNGYMTSAYENAGIITETNDIKNSKVCSYRLIHEHCSKDRKFNLIDLDTYGLPWKAFPHVVGMLANESALLVTSVKCNIPILNQRREASFIGRFGCARPAIDDYIRYIINCGLIYSKDIACVSSVMLGKNTHRMAFICKDKRYTAKSPNNKDQRRQ